MGVVHVGTLCARRLDVWGKWSARAGRARCQDKVRTWLHECDEVDGLRGRLLSRWARRGKRPGQSGRDIYLVIGVFVERTSEANAAHAGQLGPALCGY